MEITHQVPVLRVPLKQREIWAIRIRLQLAERTRELAPFNLAVDSKLRSCDLVQLRVRDVAHGEQIANRAIVMQQKTRRPVQFEITEQTRESVAAWIRYQAANRGTTSSQAGCRLLCTRPRGNMHGSCAVGCER